MRLILLSAALVLVACGQPQSFVPAPMPNSQLAARPLINGFAAAPLAQQSPSASFQFKRIQNLNVKITDLTGGWGQVSVDYDVAYAEQTFTRQLHFYYHFKNKQVDASRISASGDPASREMLVTEAQALMNLPISF